LGSKLLHKVVNRYQIGYQAKPDNHFIHSNIIDSSSTNQYAYSYNKNFKYRDFQMRLIWGYFVIHQIWNDCVYVNGSNSRYQTFHILRLQHQFCV
ncbi:MAG: hypothetical protein ACKPKO_32260, partial [Candidatus Fonsibacter sp.]